MLLKLQALDQENRMGLSMVDFDIFNISVIHPCKCIVTYLKYKFRFKVLSLTETVIALCI